MNSSKITASSKEIIKAMGLVFGDIGTSPIYTLSVIFFLTAPTPENIIGILSLIFWSLIILVTVQYAWLAMSLSIKGEGGIIVLKEMITSFLKKGRQISVAGFLGFVGVSLLMGDGVITPAISILSAVEGLELIPGFGHIETNTVILITCIITVLLFSVQFKGTDKVSSSFGPIMVLWFFSLFLSGFLSLLPELQIFSAVSPHFAINFIVDNGLPGFLVLSEVILCATGGEALYADMGHIGSKPIRQAWYFVFFALVINYFGQGAFLLSHQRSGFILFEMVRSQSEILYVPFLILTLLATIIASQAMISAVMSLIYQGITTRIFPLMKVKYTSSHLKSQIYIGIVNWILMIAVIFMILIFRESENLAAAYGFAVTATMTISSIFMIWIFGLKNEKKKLLPVLIVFIVNIAFLAAVFDKLSHGGFWSIVIAAIPFLIINLWSHGNQSMRKNFRSLPMEVFLESYNQLYRVGNNIKGTALFFTRTLSEVPPYMVHCIIRGNIIYENNILVSIHTTDSPYGIDHKRTENIAPGLSGIEIFSGYMEVLNLQKFFKKINLSEKVIFYGVEDIITKNPFLRLYSLLKKITPPFVRFYDLPYNKLHGVVTRLNL
ncbi:MAG TPA: KUP/HAK/KT family potassium transporter [Ignavibacteriaceae bacterium]|nr:KUP/HAK/KT family potassium transporter [Ignavibacteriaceae bacterium]